MAVKLPPPAFSNLQNQVKHIRESPLCQRSTELELNPTCMNSFGKGEPIQKVFSNSQVKFWKRPDPEHSGREHTHTHTHTHRKHWDLQQPQINKQFPCSAHTRRLTLKNTFLSLRTAAHHMVTPVRRPGTQTQTQKLHREKGNEDIFLLLQIVALISALFSVFSLGFCFCFLFPVRFNALCLNPEKETRKRKAGRLINAIRFHYRAVICYQPLHRD